MSLYELQQCDDIEVVGLLTTVTRDYQRISMHGVRVDLLRKQAAALGLALHVLEISKGADNAEYESTLATAVDRFKRQGIATIAFGDLFLQDIRDYREELAKRLGFEASFPIWQRDTEQLFRKFVRLGFKARVVCLDPKKLEPSFCGRELSHEFLADLPQQVDPCGERGEYHTFVYDGPLFERPVPVRPGATIFRDEFCFTELLPQT